MHNPHNTTVVAVVVAVAGRGVFDDNIAVTVRCSGREALHMRADRLPCVYHAPTHTDTDTPRHADDKHIAQAQTQIYRTRVSARTHTLLKCASL